MNEAEVIDVAFVILMVLFALLALYVMFGKIK